MESSEREIWFPRKRIGLGWGLPISWKGWVTLLIFFALVFIGAITILPMFGPFVFLAYVSALSVGLVGICWVRGERPRS